jgi:hypothetical protein
MERIWRGVIRRRGDLGGRIEDNERSVLTWLWPGENIYSKMLSGVIVVFVV